MLRLVGWMLGKVSKRFLGWWTGEVIEPQARLFPQWVTDQLVEDVDQPSTVESLKPGTYVNGVRLQDSLISLKDADLPTAEQEREAKVAEGMKYAPTVALPTLRSSLCLNHCTAGLQVDARCTMFCVQLANEQLVTTEQAEINREAKRLLDGPEVPKTIAYPKPTEDMSVTEWVDSRIGAGALSPESLNQRTDSDGSVLPKGISLRVDRGFSMRYLREIVARANRKDMTLTLDQLAAARSRGLI